MDIFDSTCVPRSRTHLYLHALMFRQNEVFNAQFLEKPFPSPRFEVAEPLHNYYDLEHQVCNKFSQCNKLLWAGDVFDESEYLRSERDAFGEPAPSYTGSVKREANNSRLQELIACSEGVSLASQAAWNRMEKWETNLAKQTKKENGPRPRMGKKRPKSGAKTREMTPNPFCLSIFGPFLPHFGLRGPFSIFQRPKFFRFGMSARFPFFTRQPGSQGASHVSPVGRAARRLDAWNCPYAGVPPSCPEQLGLQSLWPPTPRELSAAPHGPETSKRAQELCAQNPPPELKLRSLTVAFP